MNSLSIEVNLLKKDFDAGIIDLENKLLALQRQIDKAVSSLKGAGVTVERASRSGGGRSGSGDSGSKKSAENEIELQKMRATVALQEARANSSLAKTNIEVANSLRVLRAAQKGADLNEQEQIGMYGRVADAVLNFQKDNERAQKRNIETERRNAKERIAITKGILDERDKTEREYEQSQISALNRQEKIVENAGKQALQKSIQADQTLRRYQTANAEETARAYASINADKIKNDKDFYDEQGRLAKKFVNDQENERKNLGRQLRGVTDLYRQEARPAKLTPQQRAITSSESNVTELEKENRLLVEAVKNGLKYGEAMVFVRREMQALAQPTEELVKKTRKQLEEQDRLKKAAGQSQTALGSFFGTIGSFILRFSAFTIAAGLLIRVIFGIQAAITGVIRNAIDFQRKMEAASFAFTAILTNSRQLQTSTGLVADIAASYPIFLQKAKQFQQELLLLNIKTLGTGEELQAVFQRVLAFSQTQKATDKERLDLTQNITNAAKLLGLTGEQINTETRQILTLETERGQTILQSLGLAAKQLRIYRDQGTLVQELNEHLKVYSVIADDVGLTFDGLVATVSTFVDLISTAAFGQTFTGLKDILKGASYELQRLTKAGNLFVGLDSSTEDLKAFGAAAADSASKFIKLIATATNSVIDFATKNREKLSFLVDFMIGFGTALAGPLKAIDILIDHVDGLVKKLQSLLGIAKQLPGAKFFQDGSTELAKQAESNVKSRFPKGELLGGAAVGAIALPILPAIAKFATGLTGLGPIQLIALAAIGALAGALATLSSQFQKAREEAERFKGLEGTFRGVLTDFSAFINLSYPKNTDELNAYLRIVADMQRRVGTLKSEFQTSGQEGAEIFIKSLGKMQVALEKITNSLEISKNGIKFLNEEDLKNIGKLTALVKELGQELKDNAANAALTAQIFAKLPLEQQTLGLAIEEKKRNLLVEELELQQRIQKVLSDPKTQAQLYSTKKDEFAARTGLSLENPSLQLQPFPSKKQIDNFISGGFRVVKSSEEVTNSIIDNITASFKLEKQAERTANAVRAGAEAYENLIQKLRELKEETVGLERDYNKFLDQLANTSSFDAQTAALNRAIEAEKKWQDFKKQNPGVEYTQFGLDAQEQFRRQADIETKKDIFEGNEERRKVAEEAVRIEEQKAKSIASIQDSEFDKQRTIAEATKEHYEAQLSAAEDNFGKIGKVNNKLEDQIRLKNLAAAAEAELIKIEAQKNSQEIVSLERESERLDKQVEDAEKRKEQLLKDLGPNGGDKEKAAINIDSSKEQNELQQKLVENDARIAALRANVEVSAQAMTLVFDKAKAESDDLIDDMNLKFKSAFDDLDEKSAQAGRQFAQALGEFSLQSGDAVIARMDEVNLEIQEIINRLEKQFGKDNLGQFEDRLNKLQASLGSAAIVKSMKEEERYAKERVDLAEQTQESLQRIERTNLEVSKISTESRLDLLRREQSLAEKNAGISGKPNASLDERANLIRKVAQEEARLIQLDIQEQRLNASSQQAKINTLHEEISKLEERRRATIEYLSENPTVKPEQVNQANKGYDYGLTDLNNQLGRTQGEFGKTQANIDALGNKSHIVFDQMKEDVDDLSRTIVDLNNPIADAFGNLYDSFAKGGKGLKNVFKTLQKDIQQSFSDAFRESIKKKLQFDVEFKGNIFDLGTYFKDTFSQAVSFVGNLFGGNGSGGGGFFSNLGSLFGIGSSASTSSGGSSGGGFLNGLFSLFGNSGTSAQGGYSGGLGQGSYSSASPTQAGGGSLFANGASTLGSFFGFGSGGGTTGSLGSSGTFGGGNILSLLGTVASIGSLFSGSGGGGGGGLLSTIGALGTIATIGKSLFSFGGGSLGGLFGGFGSGVGGAAGSGVLSSSIGALFGGTNIAGGGVLQAGSGGLFGNVPGGFAGSASGGLVGAFSGALGGIAGSLLGNYINDKFGIGQTKQGQIGSMAGGAVGGIGGGIAAGAILGSAAGPIGTAIGALIGAIVGVIGGGALGDLFAPGRIKMEKTGINKFLNKGTENIKFKEVSEKNSAAGFETFRGPLSAAAIALGSEYATETEGGNAGTIVRFAGQGLGNFKRMGIESEEAKEHILELAEAMGFDIKSGVEALSDNINNGVLSLGEFKEELNEAKKNLKDYGDTSNLTAKELSDLATANGNTGSRLVTVNEIIAGTIDIYSEFNSFVDGAAVANEYLAQSFIDTAKATDLFNSDVENLADQISSGKLSIEEATIELNKFRKEAGLGALDLKDFKISAKEIQEQVDIIINAVETLRGALKSGLTSAVTSKSFDKEDVSKNFKKAVYQSMVDAVAEGMVDGIIKGSLAAGPISQALQSITDLTGKFVAGDLSESEFFDQLDTAFTDVKPAVDRLAVALGVSAEHLRGMLDSAGILPFLLDDATASTGGLSDAIKNAIDAGVRSGSSVDVAAQFRHDIYNSIYESVLGGFTSGFIEAAAFSGPIADAMESISDLNRDFLDGTITQEQYLTGVRDKFTEIKPIITAIGEATGIASDELAKMLADAGILPDLLNESLGVIGSITEAASGAIKAGIRAVDFDRKDVEKNFRKAIYGTLVDTIVDGFIDGFIKATLATGPIEAAMKNIKGLIDKYVAGDINFDQFGQLLTGELEGITPLVERIALALGLTTESLREILDTAGILPDILDDANSNAQDLAKELRQAAKDLLLDSSLSPLKPKQRVAEAQSQFEALRAKALAGDEEAARQLPEAARQYLEEARKVFASSTQYEKIFDFVRGTLLDVADQFGPLEDTAEKQLRTLEEIRAYLASVDINLANLTGGQAANIPAPSNLNQSGRNAPLNDGTEGDRLYHGAGSSGGRKTQENELNGDRLYSALNGGEFNAVANAVALSAQQLLKEATDELGLAQNDSQKSAAEEKLIESAQLLMLEVMAETLTSVDKSLGKIAGDTEDNLNQQTQQANARNKPSSGPVPVGRSSGSSTQGDRLEHALNLGDQPESNASESVLLLRSIDGTLKRLNNGPDNSESQLGEPIVQVFNSIKTTLDETKEFTRLVAVYTGSMNAQTIPTINYLAQIASNTSSGSSGASFANGGIVTQGQMLATLHGPEMIVPLERNRFNNFIRSSGVSSSISGVYSPEDTTPIPYSSQNNAEFHSPELIQEIRALREEVHNSKNESDDRPINLQGDMYIGEEKFGKLVQRRVQSDFRNGGLRVPNSAITKF